MEKFDVLSLLMTGFRLADGQVRYKLFYKLLYAWHNDIKEWSLESPEDLKCLKLRLMFSRDVDKASIEQLLKRILQGRRSRSTRIARSLGLQ